MSATRDKSQRIAFVYSNLYHLYKKGKEEARKATFEKSEALKKSPVRVHRSLPERFDKGRPVTGRVLKSEDLMTDLKKDWKEEVKVHSFEPPRFKNPKSLHVSQPDRKPADPVRRPQSEAVRSLKKNLNDLTDLHERLKFMLEELEGLVKKGS